MATAYIVSFNHRSYAFQSVNKAADAIKFFSGLVPVDFVKDPSTDSYYYTPDDDKYRQELTLETTKKFEPCKRTPRLPAPKRGTRPCTVCESVSVKPGTACESCGTVMEIL